MDRRAQLVARFLVAETEALVADPRRLAAGILVPVDLLSGAPGVLGAAQKLGAADQCQLGLAVGDFLGEAVHQVLGHVAAGVGVEQLPWRGAQAVGDAFGRIARTAERRGEARTDVAEELEDGQRVELASERLGADRGARVCERRASGFGAKGDARAFARGFACNVRDLAASDQDGRAWIDHYDCLVLEIGRNRPIQAADPVAIITRHFARQLQRLRNDFLYHIADGGAGLHDGSVRKVPRRSIFSWLPACVRSTDPGRRRAGPRADP